MDNDDDDLLFSEEVEFDSLAPRAAAAADEDDEDETVRVDHDHDDDNDEPVAAAVVVTAAAAAASSSSSSKKTSKKEKAAKDLPPIPSFKLVPVINTNGILVDGFKFKRYSHDIYFLSHFHSDHYVGLTKTFDFGRVYCSPITAALVRLRLGTSNAVVKALELNVPHMIENTGVQVTLFEANHCPGAVLFLFKTPDNKHFLHTGDFRYEPGMLRHFKQIKIDALYLDTTFLNAGFTFPPQREAIEYIANKVSKIVQTQGTQKHLFLVGSYSIGKERILEQIVRVMPAEKIFVSEQKLEMWKLCGLSDALMARVTLQATESRIHVVPMGMLRFDRMAHILRAFSASFSHLYAFHPTGWAFSGGRGGKEPSGKVGAELKEERRLNMTRCLVPYSEHSSFNELVEFVRALAPAEVVPTVDCDTPAKVARQLRLLQHHVSGAASRSTLEPFLKRGVSQAQADAVRAPSASSAQTPSRKTSAKAAEPDVATEVMSATLFNWLSNAQQSLLAGVDDNEVPLAPDEDAMSESDEEFGELNFGRSGYGDASTNNNDGNESAADSHFAAAAAVARSDDDFLLHLYPALVSSPTASQKAAVDASRVLLSAAEKEDPLLREKMLSEQRWLMQQFERAQDKRSGAKSGGKAKKRKQ
jgi:hypothetical protein